MPEKSILELVNSIYNSTTVLDFGALFSDGTPQFVSPAEPLPGDTVVIKFRTARNNVDDVYLVTDTEKLKMQHSSCDKLSQHGCWA